MNFTPQPKPKTVAAAVIVTVTVFAICGVALTAVQVSLANPMLPKALGYLPRLLGLCALIWFLLRGASWARWTVVVLSLFSAAVLLFPFLGSFQPSPAAKSLSVFLDYVTPAMGFGYLIVAAMLLLCRPVAAHFRQTPAVTNDRTL